jgi:hypothetical protein
MNASTTQCPGCSGSGILTDDPQVLRCTGCGGVFTGADPISFDQALKFVAFKLGMLDNAGPDGQVYFDLTIINASGPQEGKPTRVHGWADRKTKRVVQWG